MNSVEGNSTHQELAETVGYASLNHLTAVSDSGFNDEQILAVLLGLTKASAFAAIWSPNSQRILHCVGAQTDVDSSTHNVLQKIIVDRKPIVTSISTGHVLLALPIDPSSTIPPDIVLLGLDTSSHEDIAMAMQITQIIIGWFRLRRHTLDLENIKARNQHISFYLQLLVDLAEHRTFYESTLVLGTQLQTHFQASRVSLGITRNQGVQVLHVSGQAATTQKNRLVKLIANAMSESQHQKEILISGDIEKAPVQHAHRLLNDDAGNSGSCSIPIQHHEKTLCVILLEFKNKPAFEKLDRENIEQLANLLGPFIDLVKQKTSVLNSLESFAPSSWRRFKRKMKLPLIVSILSIFIASTFLVTGEFKVTANAALQADEQRSLVAPFDGYLNQSSADSGQIVSKDSELIRLDTTELELERMKWESELAKLEVDKNIAASQLKRSQLPIIETKKQQALIQLSLLSRQIEQASIKAPYEALILSSSVENRIGDRVREGEELLRIAPAGTIIAELQIEDTFISEIREGMPGMLFLKAYPGQPIEFNVIEIPQTASGGQGSAHFVVKCEIKSTLSNLNPGMEGVAQIPIREESLAKIWSNDFMNALQLYRWRLGL